MLWDSPQQINSYFDLNTPSDSLSDVRRAVVKRMAKIHPDKNDQAFFSIEVENEWHELQSAKEYIDAMSNESGLVPLSQVLSLVKLAKDADLPSIDARINTLKAEARSESKHRSYLPRIGSGVFAAISGFLFTFSNTVKGNPLIGDWVNSKEGQVLLLVLTLYSAVFFVMTWLREQTLQDKVEYLSSEKAARELLSKMLHRRSSEDGTFRKFTQQDLIVSIEETPQNSIRLTDMIRRNNRLTPTMSERIAELHIDRLSRHGIIVELPHQGLYRTFEISRVAYEDLMNLSSRN